MTASGLPSRRRRPPPLSVLLARIRVATADAKSHASSSSVRAASGRPSLWTAAAWRCTRRAEGAWASTSAMYSTCATEGSSSVGTAGINNGSTGTGK